MTPTPTLTSDRAGARRGVRTDTDERGSAMVVTVMVMAVLLVLGTTILQVTVNNLGSARRSQDAARALDAADAGISQALAYLRRNGGRPVLCSPTCVANPWGNSAAPTAVDLPGSTDQRYQVWVEPVPATAPEFFRVHSVGLAGSGVRRVQVDVELSLLGTGLPLGVFARSVQGGGAAAVQRANIYTTGCVYNRSKIQMTGTDVATGLPASVHSSRLITDSNGNNATCPSTDRKAIHRSGPCDTAAPFDQDVLGGALPPSSACLTGLSTELYTTYYAARDLDGDDDVDVDGSRLADEQALMDLFDFDDEPLSPAQLEDLRATARQQGNYHDRLQAEYAPDEAHAVLYFDLADGPDAGGIVDLKDVTTHRRTSQDELTANDSRCHDESLLIVVDGGNARFNGNPTLAASLVMLSDAPNGEIIKANGNAGIIGTVFADKINLVGTFDISLDQCFLANLAPSLYTATVTDYREIDRT